MTHPLYLHAPSSGHLQGSDVVRYQVTRSDSALRCFPATVLHGRDRGRRACLALIPLQTWLAQTRWVVVEASRWPGA